MQCLPILVVPGEKYAQAWQCTDKTRMTKTRWMRPESQHSEDKRGYSQEFRTVCKDGSTRWLLETVSVTKAGAGRWRCVGVCADLTDRKRAEADLEDSVERYRLLFERNPQPMWVFDRETHRFLAVNNAAIQHYGYPEAEFLTLTVRDIRPPEEAGLLVERLECHVAGDQGIWNHKRKDGTTLEVDVNSNPIDFSGRPGISRFGHRPYSAPPGGTRDDAAEHRVCPRLTKRVRLSIEFCQARGTNQIHPHD